MNVLKLLYFYIFINCVSTQWGQSSECCMREISSELFSNECIDSPEKIDHQFLNFSKSVNPSLGLLDLEVIFPYDICTDKFIYLLKHQYVQNQNECTGDADFLKYTNYEYIHTRLISEETKCIQKGIKEILKFSNVFSGCYTVEIINCSENQEEPFLLSPFYVETDVEYIHMTKDCRPKVFPQVINEDKKTLDISVTFSKSTCITNNTLSINLNTYSDFIHNIKIKNSDSKNKTFNFHVNNHSSNVDCFRNTNTSINCVIKKLHSDVYHVIIKLLDEPRCKLYTLWNLNTSLPCEWDLKINIKDLTQRKNNTERHSNIIIQNTTIQSVYYIIIFIAISVVVSVLLYILFTYFRLKNSANRNNENLIQRVDFDKKEIRTYFYNQLPRVFLLYARDCDEFMTLMGNFKNCLQKNGISEVFDIFDEDMKDVCTFQEKWILEKIVDPDIKIILVLTELAQLNYSLNDTYSLYKKPIFKDKYFTYALKKIIENFSSDYQKLYVVELETPFTKHCKEFEIINPCRRYVLPRHFNELIMNILCRNIENAEFETYKFTEAFNTYRLYTTNNPEYLKNILNL